MFGLGTQELLIIFLILLVFFGATKIPQLARSLGKGIGEFRKAQQEAKDEIQKGDGSAAAFVVCPSCRSKAAAGTAFCAKCGQSMQDLACPSCRRPLQPDDRFCPGCGQAIR